MDTPVGSTAALDAETSSALCDPHALSEPHHTDVINRLQHLLMQADDAYDRYRQDWKLADINERIWLLKSAFETAEPLRLDIKSTAGMAHRCVSTCQPI